MTEELTKKVEALETSQTALSAAQQNLQKHVDQLSLDVREIKQALGQIATKSDIGALSAKVDNSHSMITTALRTVPLGAVVAFVTGVIMLVFGMFAVLLFKRGG